MKQVIVLMVLLALLIPAVAFAAGSTKFTFNDVTFPDGATGELEASSKVGKKTSFSTCSYYSDDYLDYLGYYDSDAFASTDAGEVLDFCLYHYFDRVVH